MGHTEFLAGRMAQSYLSFFKEDSEKQLAADLYAMFLYYFPSSVSLGWLPMASITFLRSQSGLNIVEVGNPKQYLDAVWDEAHIIGF